MPISLKRKPQVAPVTGDPWSRNEELATNVKHAKKKGIKPILRLGRVKETASLLTKPLHGSLVSATTPAPTSDALVKQPIGGHYLESFQIQYSRAGWSLLQSRNVAKTLICNFVALTLQNTVL